MTRPTDAELVKLLRYAAVLISSLAMKSPAKSQERSADVDFAAEIRAAADALEAAPASPTFEERVEAAFHASGCPDHSANAGCRKCTAMALRAAGVQ